MSNAKGLLSCLLLITLVCLGDAIRTKRTSFLGDDTNIHTEYVDRNNRTIWAMFNLTEEQLSRIMAGNNANGQEEAPNTRDSQYFNHIKEARIKDIRSRLESAFDASSNSDENQEGAQHPQHEVAAYPLCNAESNAENWLQDNNVTIQFSDSILDKKRDNLNLDSAILRLYKMNPNKTDDVTIDEELSSQTAKSCSEPQWESQIRVTVSIIQQLRRNKQRKKRICNTMMLSVTKTGWIEIDIKRALYIWEQVMREQQQLQQQQQQQQQQQLKQARPPVLVGWLMIEVHDEEERPLKPGLFFKPPNCKEADFAIPWNYYGSKALTSNIEANQVPRYPRLDVILIGYASFAPKNYNINLNKKLHENLLRQLYNLSKNNNNNNNKELEQQQPHAVATTSNSPAIDNLLGALTATSNEMLHQHQKRQQQTQQQQPTPQEAYTDVANEQDEQTEQLQRHLKHHSHGRHRRHHHHHHFHHHHQQQQQQQQQHHQHSAQARA